MHDLSGGTDGIRIEKGHGNLVADNTVADVRAAGIRLGITNPLLGGEDNVVRENLVTPGSVGRSFQADGFVVGKKDDHSLLKRNVAKGAGADGFDVQSRTTKLTQEPGGGQRRSGYQGRQGCDRRRRKPGQSERG